MEINYLINKSVESVWVSKENDLLKFVMMDNEIIIWQALGDCCSNSYFQDVQSLDFKGRVLSIEESTLEAADRYSSLPNEVDGIYMSYHFYLIKSECGRLDIGFRNESNGYYDGYILALYPCSAADEFTSWIAVE